MQISALYIYPVKSLAGLAVPRAQLQTRGFWYDRRFMLIDRRNTFVTQRKHPHMALLRIEDAGDAWRIHHTNRRALGSLEIPKQPAPLGATLQVNIWEDTVQAQPLGQATDRWFSEALGMDLRLVYLPDSAERQVDLQYAEVGDQVSLADGFPYLITNSASLQDLQKRLGQSIDMRRFRPNIVVDAAQAWEEDQWTELRSGEIRFRSLKPCARCQLITVDPDTAERSAEPLRILASARHRDNEVLFGVNAVWAAERSTTQQYLAVGDQLQVG